MPFNIKTWIVSGRCVLAASMALSLSAFALPVTLGSPTATFCQPAGGGPFPISAAIDGSFAAGNGWAIDPQEGVSQVAVLKTATDVGTLGSTDLTFNLHMLYNAHLIGRFRLAATTSARTTYGLGAACADANPGGTAVWSVLHPVSVVSASGQTLTVQGDDSVLSSGSSPNTDVVTVRVTTPLAGITGFRLEALADPSLPFNGPGRQITNGNFVLTEIVVDARSEVAVPALGPSALVLMVLLLGSAGMLWLRRGPA